MATYKIDGQAFYAMLKGGAVNLRNNAQIVNELNVFPIPDGDTGENMARTIEGGVSAATTHAESDISAIAEAVASGMLLSARGNSGVILSQYFEGYKKGLAGCTRAGVAELKAAMRCGVEQAYSAVYQPTEGTILTVMREGYERVKDMDDGATVEELFEAYLDELYASVERTPDLLAVLKEAGVVDSGGAGFIYITEGMINALRGDVQSEERAATVTAAEGADNFNENSKMVFGYCTEAIVQLMSAKTDVEGYNVDTLIDYLGSIGGDSIVAFKTGTRIKLHVHTFEPNKVFEYCLSIGELVSVKVENMSIQHTETVIRNRFERRAPQKRHKKYACVAVADGAGLIDQFRSLGADIVVDGKQTMNPSTQDFISAFDEADADTIFVLPNNSNVIMAANQAAEIYEGANIVVIPSKTLAEGYAALSMLDYTSDNAEEIKAQLVEAAESVATGLITFAVRDCTVSGKHIRKNDRLGFNSKELISCAKNITTAATELLDGMDMTDKTVIIAMRGKDGVCDDDISRIQNHVNTAYPDMEFYEFDGGQDVYSLIFVVE